MMEIGVHDTRKPESCSRELDMRPSVIRAWAVEQELPVASGGRIPDAIRDLYVAAMERTQAGGS